MTRHWMIGAVAAAVVLAGCGGAKASAEEYDQARQNYVEQVVSGIGIDPADATFTVTDSEIDCISKATKISVEDLAKGDNKTTEADTDTKNLRCLSSESARAYFADAVTSTGGTSDAMTASGIDRDCVLDVMVSQFDAWKASDAMLPELTDSLQGPDFEQLTAPCTSS